MCMSLPIPLPGLHSGLDSLRFCTITIAQPTIYCRQHSMAQSVPLHCWLLPNTVLCCPGSALSRSGARSSTARASHSGQGSKSFTNQVKSQHHCRERREASTVTDGGLGVGFLVVVGGCRESLLGEQWNVAVVTHIQHMQTKWSEATSRKKLSRQGTHTSRAACTIDDLVDGRKRALSMTSSMDAQREGNI